MTHPLELLQLRNLKELSHDVQRLLEKRLWAQILLAMILAFGAGLALSPDSGWLPSSAIEPVGEWLALPGQLFLAAIQMIVVPLVVASVVRGIASSGDLQQLRTTGLGLAVYFVVTAIAATTIGILVGLVLQPGSHADPELVQSLIAQSEGIEIETLPDQASIPTTIVGLLPTNPLSAMAQGEMLQVVVFSIVFGAALISLAPESSRPLLELFGSLQEVALKIVGFVMRFAPIAVFGLLARSVMATGSAVLTGLGYYVGSVLLSLLLLLLLYLLIVGLLARRSPLQFLTGMREPQLLAFSTGSSAATMPVTIRAVEDKMGVRASTAELVMPLGATVNMDGTACYHGVATLFLAQLFGMDISSAMLVSLVATSLGASIGAPATPGVGIMILATVLGGAGVPLSGITLIIGVDQILERFRTVLNVTGDGAAALVMERFIKSGHSAEEEARREQERGDRDVATVASQA